jgi:hypothetical protein
MTAELYKPSPESLTLWARTVGALACGAKKILIPFPFAGGITFQLSTRAEIAQLDPALYFCVLQHLQVRLANIKLHSFVELAPSPDSLILEPRAILFDHVVINHTRYVASSRSAHPYTSFIAVRSSASANSQIWVGELRSILAIEQPGTTLKTIHRFGYVRWFRPTTVDLSRTVWAQL